MAQVHAGPQDRPATGRRSNLTTPTHLWCHPPITYHITYGATHLSYGAAPIAPIIWCHPPIALESSPAPRLPVTCRARCEQAPRLATGRRAQCRLPLPDRLVCRGAHTSDSLLHGARRRRRHHLIWLSHAQKREPGFAEADLDAPCCKMPTSGTRGILAQPTKHSATQRCPRDQFLPTDFATCDIPDGDPTQQLCPK